MPNRSVPRPFEFHWGRGQIIEEASVVSAHHEPAIQLLEYQGGELNGRRAVRFCHYNLNGRFSRSPLLISQDDVTALGEALRRTPELRDLLLRLVASEPEAPSD